MTKFWSLALVGMLAATTASAADPDLLGLIMPDAKVVAGLHVAQSKTSPFGQYVLSHIQTNDTNLQKLIAETGFDPTRDVSELLFASNGGPGQHEGIVIARGVFDPVRIATAMRARGAVGANFMGTDIYSGPSAGKNGNQGGIAFLDATTAVMGDLDSVKGAITRRGGGNAPSSDLLAKVSAISGQYDFWFATLVPLSNFAGAIPDRNLSGAMQNGNVFQAITETSGGLRFGSNIQFTADAVTRSDKDATALADVLRFFASLIQNNQQAPSQVAALANTLTLDTTGNVTHLSLSIPESQLEQMLAQGREQAHVGRAHRKPAVN